MTVDAVRRTVMPAGVKQPMMSATTDFSGFGFSAFGPGVLYAGATFRVRLLACFFVSHNCSFFLLLSFLCFAPHHPMSQRALILCQFRPVEASVPFC